MGTFFVLTYFLTASKCSFTDLFGHDEKHVDILLFCSLITHEAPGVASRGQLQITTAPLNPIPVVTRSVAPNNSIIVLNNVCITPLLFKPSPLYTGTPISLSMLAFIVSQLNLI
jgi:hypothetical protein